MTTAYTTPEAHVRRVYRQTGQRYIRQADAEFEKGNLAQASEKAWAAASEHIKALAALRGFVPESHRELRWALYQIVGKHDHYKRISELLAIGEGLITNSRDDWMSPKWVKLSIEDMKELIYILDSISISRASPLAIPPISQLFIRNRGDGQ